jgi:hypothetical protein
MRAADELRSAKIFRALHGAARTAGMGPTWTRRFRAAAFDELGHARLCAAVGCLLGALDPEYDDRMVRERLARLGDPELRTVALLLVEVAMGETISMYLFRAARRSSEEPLTRVALGAIVADEVRHQRLGWEGFAALRPGLTPRLIDAAQREAAMGLAATERQIAVPALRWLERRQPFDPAYAALGVLHPESRAEAYYFAVERLVLPRLTRAGLDGQLAWKERYRVTAA